MQLLQEIKPSFVVSNEIGDDSSDRGLCVDVTMLVLPKDMIGESETHKRPERVEGSRCLPFPPQRAIMPNDSIFTTLSYNIIVL